MDAETLFDHRDLWGLDPEPNVGVFELLTPGERATLQSLSAGGNIRLEQERIPWSYALAAGVFLSRPPKRWLGAGA
ncbi:DUF2220 domain-containing protein [Microbacterium sp. LWS13-1.2]|uniref:DUF2220 domain-containing protein n=2 Tax=Microbacterium sp. LWS13-1.2 TaxID=3135264 RepID=A0AAU6SBE6_9MICO